MRLSKQFIDSMHTSRERVLNLSEAKAFNNIINAKTPRAERKAINELSVLFGFMVLQAIDKYVIYKVGNIVYKMEVTINN